MAELLTFPKLVQGNGHAILFFRDPADYPYLREARPMKFFACGLPNVNLYEEYGDDLVAIECPKSPDEEGIPGYRAWVYFSADKYPKGEWTPEGD